MTTATKPLMPKATAVWLVENTALTFEQIAEFCDLHMLEVQGIADGDVAQGIRGKDPINGGELTREEIRRGEADSKYRLKLRTSKVQLPEIKGKKAPRYTPVSRRQDRPNAILWLLKHHPEMKDTQIIKLVGTTKPTIKQIKERSHWNSAQLTPQDPVALGLCSQVDLDNEVQKAAARVQKERLDSGDAFTPAGGTLSPTAQTTGYTVPGFGEQPSEDDRHDNRGDAAVLERLNRMSSREDPDREAERTDSIDSVFSEHRQSSADVPATEPEPLPAPAADEPDADAVDQQDYEGDDLKDEADDAKAQA